MSRDTQSLDNLDGLEWETKKKYYGEKFCCHNCMGSNIRYIPKGNLINSVQAFDCKNCGCQITPQPQTFKGH